MKKQVIYGILQFSKYFIIALVIALILRTFVITSILVDGRSMEPTLRNNDRLIGNIVPIYFSDIKRGDIVIFQSWKTKDMFIKRAVGLEGDLVEIKEGKLYLNGEELVEEYLEEGSYTHTKEADMWIVGKGELFVLGDNRQLGASKDSRHFGPIKLDSVKARANFRYYPIDDNFGKIDKK